MGLPEILEANFHIFVESFCCNCIREYHNLCEKTNAVLKNTLAKWQKYHCTIENEEPNESTPNVETGVMGRADI